MAHAGARTQAHYSAPTAHAAQSAQTSSTAASGACTGVSTCLCAERRARPAGRSRRDPSAPRRSQFGESGLLENEPTAPAEQAHTTRFLDVRTTYHVLAAKGDWAALAVLEHAYAAAAGRRDLHVHALWREVAAVAIPGACHLFRREQLSVFFVRSLLSLTHGRGVNLVVLQEGSVWRIPRLLQSRPACCRVDRLRRSGCSLGCYSFCQIWVYLE